MRAVTGLVITLALLLVFAILVANEWAQRAGGLFNSVSKRITEATE